MAGAGVRLTWHGRQVEADLRRQLERRVRVAGEMLRGEIVRRLKVSTRANGASTPDQYPHRDTGKLSQSIFSEMDERNLTAVVGTTLDYGRFLATGTGKMEPRPRPKGWLEQTLDDMRPQLIDYITRPIR